MKIVFAHQNFPAQFGEFGVYLARDGWDVTFATANKDAKAPLGCRLVRVPPHRDPTNGVHRFARPVEKAMINGQAFANAAMRARETAGVEPDVVVAHSGWGSGTFAKAVWPNCKFVPYVEWWYRHPPIDWIGMSKLPSPEDGAALALAKNAPTMMDLAEADLILCPTQFQARQFPEALRQRMVVMHDGVDTDRLRPDPGARLVIGDLDLSDAPEIITYATRGMEPHRGFPEFMRALAVLQKRRPRLRAVIAGQDRVAYGPKLPEGRSWKRIMLDELDLDLDRIHFIGTVGSADLLRLFQATHAHVYLTVPFVLSWSLIEAMSVGAPIVASNAEPVREALKDGWSARLVDHRDIEALAAAIEETLDDPASAQLGANARADALRRYARNWIWPARAEILRDLATRS